MSEYSDEIIDDRTQSGSVFLQPKLKKAPRTVKPKQGNSFEASLRHNPVSDIVEPKGILN